MKSIKGYKGFDKNLKCRGKQYKENQIFEEEDDPVLCERGFHFCEMPLDVFTYYPPKVGAEYAEVEAIGEIKKGSDKVVTNKLKIKSKLTISGLFKAHFDLIFNKDIEYESEASGDEGHASANGWGGHASASGDGGHASANGRGGHASASGDNGIAASLGIQSKSSAKKGWIVIVDWRKDVTNKYYIHNIYKAKVGKHKIQKTLIKPNVWYWFENGQLKSEENEKTGI